MGKLEISLDGDYFETNAPTDQKFSSLKKYVKAGWIIQPKRDGNQILYSAKEGFVQKRGMVNDNVPELREQLKGIVPDGTVLQGEMVYQTETDFGTADDCGTVSGMLSGKRKANSSAIQFIAFDVLKYKGEDCRTKTYSERYAILEELGIVRIQNLSEDELIFDHEECSKIGFEGYIVRDPSKNYYAPIFRLKAKIERDMRIIGWKSSATKDIATLTCVDDTGEWDEVNVQFPPKFMTMPLEEIRKEFESGRHIAVVRFMGHQKAVGRRVPQMNALNEIRYQEVEILQ